MGPLVSGGPSKWHWEISNGSLKTPPFFFGDHLNTTGKTVKISVKTFFFFRRSHLFRTKLQPFLCLFWTSQNRKSVIFELVPGPLSVPGATGNGQCAVSDSILPNTNDQSARQLALASTLIFSKYMDSIPFNCIWYFLLSCGLLVLKRDIVGPSI